MRTAGPILEMTRKIFITNSVVFKVTRFIGLTIFNSKGEPTTSLICKSFFSTVLLVSFVSSVRFYMLVDLHEDPEYVSGVLIPFSLNMFMAITCLAHCIACYKHRHEMGHVIKSLRAKNRKNESMFLFIGVFVHVAMTFYGPYTLYDCVISIAIAWPGLWNYFIALQFREIVIALTEAMQILTCTVGKRKSSALQRDHLMDAVVVLNRTYQWQLLLILAQIFGYGVGYVFLLMECARDAVNLSFNEYDLMTFYSAMLLSRIMMLSFVTNCCHRFYSQVSGDFLLSFIVLRLCFSCRGHQRFLPGSRRHYLSQLQKCCLPMAGLLALVSTTLIRPLLHRFVAVREVQELPRLKK